MTSGTFSCHLPNEIPVNNFNMDITKPTFVDRNLTDSHGDCNLSTIVDGSTTKPLDFGSEVIVYLEQELASGFTVSFSYCIKLELCHSESHL